MVNNGINLLINNCSFRPFCPYGATRQNKRRGFGHILLIKDAPIDSQSRIGCLIET